MTERGNARVVFSTGSGRICVTCGWPQDDCHCSRNLANEPVPARIVAKLRMEKKGRAGKMVTVVDGLPRNAAFLNELIQELKRLCGTGGAAKDGAVELQGDLRGQVREALLKRGFAVKG
jgi:translation initiation factor 1